MANTIQNPSGSESGAQVSSRWLTVLIVIATVALAAAFYFLVHEQSRRPGANSRAPTVDQSALGLRVLVELLLRLDIPVQPVSVLQNIEDDAYRAVVLLPDVTRRETIDAALHRYAEARAIVFVLPKWIPIVSRGRAKVELSPTAPVDEVVEDLVPGASVVRAPDATGLAASEGYLVPTVVVPQMVRSDQGLVNLVGTSEAALFARIEEGSSRFGGTPVFLLADPDPLQNHAIDDGSNAEFIVNLLTGLAGEDGKLLIDDTSAGATRPPWFWRELFRPPLIGLTSTSFAALALICLSGAYLFGGRDEGRMTLPSGRGTILEASVALVARNGHASTVVERYWRSALNSVAQRYLAPQLSNTQRLIAFLTPIEAERGVARSCSWIDSRCRQLRGSRSSADAVALARAIHSWKREMLGWTLPRSNGSTKRSDRN